MPDGKRVGSQADLAVVVEGLSPFGYGSFFLSTSGWGRPRSGLGIFCFTLLVSRDIHWVCSYLI